MDAFTRAFNFTVSPRIEGGYVDNPHDPGGATNHGVTQRVYDAWRETQGLPLRSVREIELPETESIYRHMYWHPAHCDQMPDSLAICHFDFAVNHGVTGAAKVLQEAAGVTADGIIGPATLAAIEGTLGITAKYLDARAQWYRDDVVRNPAQGEFLDGWLNRVAQLRAYVGVQEA